MGFQDWSDLCADTVTVEPFASRDPWGVVTYGSARTYQARISQGKNRSIRTRDNVEAVSSVQVYIDATPQVGADDRITLPSDFTVRTPPIIAVARIRDENGPHHQCVYC